MRITQFFRLFIAALLLALLSACGFVREDENDVIGGLRHGRLQTGGSGHGPDGKVRRR